MSAIKTADKAANDAFDAYLKAHKSTATMHVPPAVVEAAKAAYREAGGKGEIVVKGHGNTTHPVCSVSVQRAAEVEGDE